MTVLLLRSLFTLLVTYGLLLNMAELRKANVIYDRLIQAKVNGLKHQSAHHLIVAARYRLAGSVFLCIIAVTAMLVLPPESPDHPWLLLVARLSFLGIAVKATLAAHAARRYRIRTEALIDVELGSTLPPTASERI